ncbi:serine hydrolase [Hoeflea sp.]|uniref:serine hydrolase n=1 Tax=Hoeflea sp. TaxID=1940281 RepID=UPI003B021FBB
MLIKRFLGLGAIIGSASLFMTAGTMSAADIHDPDSVGWAFRNDLTDKAYASAWKSYKNRGYMPVDIDTIQGSSPRYSGVWQRNVDGRDWVSFRNLTSEKFGEHWKTYRAKGYRLIDQDMDLVGGKLRYSMVMVENKEGLKWSSNRNMSSEKFTKAFNDMKKTHKPIDIDAVETNGKLLYSVIWVENTARQGWAQLRDMTPKVYGEKFKEFRKQGYRVADLDCYLRNGKLTYAAIWEKNTPGRGWSASRGMSANDLRNKWRRLSDQGMRIIDIEQCAAPDGKGIRYAAVWRENGDRLDWPGRKDAEKLLMDFADGNPAVPGVSAAIVSRGKTLFRGGRGFADAEKNIHAHGGSIYRTASLAKSVTGALGFAMANANEIDLDERTDMIVEGLGSNHRHTVLNLLKNVGCIGQYGQIPGDLRSDQTQYASSQLALTEKLEGVLASNDAIISPCTPGNDDQYSTPGYTIAAAALEIEGEADFPALLRKYITGTKGTPLPTLRAETRSGPDSDGELVKLYGRNANQAYSPVTREEFQNNSWRWAGGGLETSPVDFARFGDALLRNKYFPRSVLMQMWSGSAASGSYGAGWDLTFATDDTTTLTAVAKRGRQQAALAHIRIDPINNIVVVAMTNGTFIREEASIINRLTADLMLLAGGSP